MVRRALARRVIAAALGSLFLIATTACRTSPVRQAVTVPAASAHPAESLHEFTYTEVHMGMPVRLVLHVATEEDAREAARAAFDRVAALDDVMSDYRPQSELSRLNRASGEWMPVSADLLAVLVR